MSDSVDEGFGPGVGGALARVVSRGRWALDDLFGGWRLRARRWFGALRRKAARVVARSRGDFL